MNANILSWAILIFSSCSATNYLQNGEDINVIAKGSLEKHILICPNHSMAYKHLYIYLPRTYYSVNKSFPVVYMLHGGNGNEGSWIHDGDILQTIDSLVVRKELIECIYVFPNMNNYHNYFECLNSIKPKSVKAYLNLNGYIETIFVNDIIEYIDGRFRTIPHKEYRALCGLSIGGLQAIYISANNPDTFGHIGLFSPLIYPPLNIGRYSSVYRNLEKKLSIQFESQPSTYMIMIGKDDAYLKGASMYGSYLYEQGYNISFHKTPGGHTWDNWKDYSIQFLKSLWSPVSSSNDD